MRTAARLNSETHRSSASTLSRSAAESSVTAHRSPGSAHDDAGSARNHRQTLAEMGRFLDYKSDFNLYFRGLYP